MSDKQDTNKIPITLSEDQWHEVEKYKNVLGDSRAKMVRAIIVDWLLDRTKHSTK